MCCSCCDINIMASLIHLQHVLHYIACNVTARAFLACTLIARRGAEAGGILGVNTPTFLVLQPPLFVGAQKCKLERKGN